MVLRELQENAWPAVLAYESELPSLRDSAWTGRTAEDVRAFVRHFIDWQGEQPRRNFQFAVVLKGEGRLIGNCGIRTNPDRRDADIGYELAHPHWGRGYATEAARAVLAFGFEELRLHRIWASCVLENAGSGRVLEKLGMRREGHLREHEWMRGRWWDTLLYAILDREWQHQGMLRR